MTTVPARHILWSGIFTLCVTVPASLLADQNAGPAEQKGASTKSDLNVEVTVDPPDRRISDSRVIKVKITTNWVGEVKEVIFEPGAQLQAARPDWAGVKGVPADAQLNTNIENVVPINLPAANWFTSLLWEARQRTHDVIWNLLWATEEAQETGSIGLTHAGYQWISAAATSASNSR